MSRRLRYHVAVSLDGFIADRDGGYDWLASDASIDFRALHNQFDTAIMGRKTFEVVKANGGDGSIPGLDVIVFSRTLQPLARKGFRITNADPAHVMADLKARDGGDIWLFGGGGLFRTLSDGGLVDTVEVALMPILLGDGIRLLPPGGSVQLVLGDHRVLPKSGIIALSYAVKGMKTKAPPIAYVKSR